MWDVPHQFMAKTSPKAERNATLKRAWVVFLNDFDSAIVTRQGLLGCFLPKLSDAELVTLQAEAGQRKESEDAVLVDAFREMALEFPEAFTVRGVLSDGSPFLSRLRVGAPESTPMSKDALGLYQERRADKMNALGADVAAVFEVIDPDTLTWRPCDL